MDVIKSFKFLEDLTSCTRYSNTRLLVPENVMEHTACVSFIASQLGLEILSIHSKEGLGPAFRMDELLLKALYHDAEETVTGDVIRSVKHHSPESKEAFEKIALEGMTKIMNDLDLCSEANNTIMNSWYEAKSGRTGCLISIADLASVLYKVHQEVLMLGNLNMMTSIEKVPSYLEELRSKVHAYYGHSEGCTKYLLSYLAKIECIYDAAVKKAEAEFNYLAQCVAKVQ